MLSNFIQNLHSRLCIKAKIVLHYSCFKNRLKIDKNRLKFEDSLLGNIRQNGRARYFYGKKIRKNYYKINLTELTKKNMIASAKLKTRGRLLKKWENP